uniref:Histone-lysine N-methyltransferase ASHR1-like protein-2 n=1 Tax=Brachionus koreanus TaxID=1199090 RepID=A0A513TZH8_9BILA|nr:histone-lysine N-methyltransferase ASHR1-like protein-2 [Brachionus koreanus]
MSENKSIQQYQPYVYCLIFEKKKKYCDFCFKELSKVCSCPICNFMHYCNRYCEKNDTIHRFECQNLKKFESKFLEDNILVLFLRTLIRTKKISDFDAKLFMELDSSNQQNIKLIAIKYIDEILKLMGPNFIETFNTNEMISYFDKMMANKIEIKSNRSETIGLGIYLENAFDDSEKSNTDVSFDGLKIIYRRKIFPALSFSELATDSCYLKNAIRIANKFLKSRTMRDFYLTKIKLKTEFLHEKMSQVKIAFEEQIKAKPNDTDFLAWTDRNIPNKININQIFENRLKIINKLADSMDHKEEEIIIVFIGLLIIHEFAHLLYRWNGNFHSPDSKEAGNSLEKLIFDGHIRAIISPKTKWNKNSKFLGIAIDTLSKLQGRKYLSYTDYIKKIYDNTMPLNSYLSLKFEDKPEEENIKAIKQCDENGTDEDESTKQSSDLHDLETLNIQKCGT